MGIYTFILLYLYFYGNNCECKISFNKGVPERKGAFVWTVRKIPLKNVYLLSSQLAVREMNLISTLAENFP